MAVNEQYEVRRIWLTANVERVERTMKKKQVVETELGVEDIVKRFRMTISCRLESWRILQSRDIMVTYATKRHTLGTIRTEMF